MTHQNQLHDQQIPWGSFIRPALIGAGLALLVISFFVFGVDAPKPEWGKYWQIRPLIITPLAGAAGGAFHGFMNYQSKRGFNRILAVSLSIVVFIIALWMGIVLGLAATMWD